jgi:hypothetical protein
LAKRRPIFTGQQTIAAAHEPYRTMFTVAALIGARMSELCGLTWQDVDISGATEAEVTFGSEVDRKGNRCSTKTDGSARTVPIPCELAVLLARHRIEAQDTRADHFVFATRTGRPLGQRNVQRALREAERDAVDCNGRPPFPILHEIDVDGEPVKVPRAVCHRCIPSVTRSHRVRWSPRKHRRGGLPPWSSRRDRQSDRLRCEIAAARGGAMRRSRMVAEYDGVLRVALEDDRE